MKVMISAGFGEPITDPWMDECKRVANGVRQSIPNGSNAEYVHELMQELADSGMDMILNIAGWDYVDQNGEMSHGKYLPKPSVQEVHDLAKQIAWEARALGVTSRATLEVGNEIDLDDSYRKNLSLFYDTVVAARRGLDEIETGVSIQLIAGSVSNIQRRGRKMLEKWMHWVNMLDFYALVSVHPYRTTETDPSKFAGFSGPIEVAVWLRNTLGDRVCVTEGGWHDGEQRYKKGLYSRLSQLTEEEVARCCEYEMMFWGQVVRSPFYTWYQIRDGAPDDPDKEAHFGVCREDFREKLVANVLSKHAHP